MHEHRVSTKALVMVSASPSSGANGSSVADLQFEVAVLVPSQEEQKLRPVPLLVAAFPSKTGSALIKGLGSAAPLTDLRHLKRVRKAPDDASLLEAILCLAPDGLAAQPTPSHAAPAPQQHEQQAGAVNDQQQQAQPSWSDAPPDALPEPLRQMYESHGGVRLRLMYGAADAPQTRQQWDAWNKIWPITWRIPDHGAPVTEETPVDAATQRYFEHHMRLVLQLARTSCRTNAASLVEPPCLEPLATGVDGTVAGDGGGGGGGHPLHHAVMCAIQAASERDLTLWPPEGAEQGQGQEDAEGEGQGQRQGEAKGEGRGLGQQQCVEGGQQGDGRGETMQWEAGCGEHHRRRRGESAERQHGQGERQQAQGGGGVAGAGEAGGGCRGGEGQGRGSGQGESNQGEELACKRARVDDGSAGGTSGDGQQQAAAGGAGGAMGASDGGGGGGGGGGSGGGGATLRRALSNASIASTAARPYMCTGYDCFVIMEPCIMCAMALVHSRVQRVIYCEPDPRFGSLGGCRRLHACRSLNHNYQVYRMRLAGAAQAAGEGAGGKEGDAKGSCEAGTDGSVG